MGTFRVQLEVAGPARERFLPVDDALDRAFALHAERVG